MGTVIFMIPCENVRLANGARADGESKLVSIACVAEEKEMVERHINLSEVRPGSERKIVGEDALDWPN